jgi:hypothetical protein
MMGSHPLRDRSALRRACGRRQLPTIAAFACLHDHQRLPWRFFGRFTASAEAGLRRRSPA